MEMGHGMAKSPFTTQSPDVLVIVGGPVSLPFRLCSQTVDTM